MGVGTGKLGGATEAAHDSLISVAVRVTPMVAVTATGVGDPGKVTHNYVTATEVIHAHTSEVMTHAGLCL